MYEITTEYPASFVAQVEKVNARLEKSGKVGRLKIVESKDKIKTVNLLVCRGKKWYVNLQAQTKNLTDEEWASILKDKPLKHLKRKKVPRVGQKIKVYYDNGLKEKWSVIAEVEPVSGDDNTAIYTKFGDEPLPEKIGRKKLPQKYHDQCDHCKSGKRNRHSAFVVKSEKTNRYRWVGKTCLNEYTGLEWKLVQKLMSYRTQSNESSSGAGWITNRSAETTKQKVAESIARFYKANGAYEKQIGHKLKEIRLEDFDEGEVYDDGYIYGENLWRTKIDKGYYHFEKGQRTHRNGIKYGKPSVKMSISRQISLEKSFLDYVDKLEPTGEYDRKVKKLHDAGSFKKKFYTTYAGISYGWMNYLNDLLLEKKGVEVKKEPTKKLNLEIGDTFEGKVIFIDKFSKGQGWTLYKFITPNNEAIVTFNDNACGDLKIGDTYQMRGRVKGHKSFKNEYSTTIGGRVKVE